jgi:FkbM family methyltransferase
MTLIEQFIAPGYLVFDVGANVGDRTEMFLDRGARVVAVEPQPPCIHALQDRFAGRPEVVIEPKALGRTPGTLEMRVANASTVSSMSEKFIAAVQETQRFPNVVWDETLSVPITTLDHLIERHGLPAFCKIDVEGYEIEVLAGLSQPIRVLCFETHPELRAEALACLERLQELDPAYRFGYSPGETLTLDPRRWMTVHEMTDRLTQISGNIAFGDIYAIRT